MQWAFTIRLLPIFIMPAIAFAENCENAKTQTDMNACVYQEYQALDQKLNKAYSEYRSLLMPSQKRQLKEVQLAWIKFRDLSCTFESSGVEGGSIQPFIKGSCLTEKTRDRLNEITRLSNCKEGDLCPSSK